MSDSSAGIWSDHTARTGCRVVMLDVFLRRREAGMWTFTCSAIHNLFTHIHNAFLVCEHTFGSAAHLERVPYTALLTKAKSQILRETLDFMEMQFIVC